MPKEPIVFKCEDSLWRILADGTKQWDARRWDLSDDRIYRLAWGHLDDPPLGAQPTWFPREQFISFLNKATGEQLTFRLSRLEFADWAPGWVFIILERAQRGQRVGCRTP
ncbi:MAG: hypothetical protein ACOC58_00215 [Chloroflexota bacterium]